MNRWCAFNDLLETVFQITSYRRLESANRLWLRYKRIAWNQRVLMLCYVMLCCMYRAPRSHRYQYAVLQWKRIGRHDYIIQQTPVFIEIIFLSVLCVCCFKWCYDLNSIFLKYTNDADAFKTTQKQIRSSSLNDLWS